MNQSGLKDPGFKYRRMFSKKAREPQKLLRSQKFALVNVSESRTVKPPEGGGYLTKFKTGRLRPEVPPLTLLYTILVEKLPLLCTFYLKKVPLSHTYLWKSCSYFHVVLNKSTDTAIRGVSYN